MTSDPVQPKPKKAHAPKKDKGHTLEPALSSPRHENHLRTRIIFTILATLVIIIILANILAPLFFQNSNTLQFTLVEALLDGALLLVMVYGLYYFKRSQDILRRAEEQFRLVSYATNDVVWKLELSSGKFSWNQSMYRVLGYAPDQTGQDIQWWQEQIHPDDRPTVMKIMQSALDENEGFWSKEYRFRRGDGTYAIVFDRSYVIHDEQGNPVRMLGAMMDITEWRRTEKELAAERNLLRTLVDLLPDRIYVKDTESRFILKNLSDARAMGASSTDEVVGKTDFDYYKQELAAMYYADDQAVIKSGKALIDHEEPSFDPKGKEYWILTTKVPLRDSSGEIIGLAGIGHDITERKQIERELQSANQQLTAKVDELEKHSRESNMLNEMRFLLQTSMNEKEAYTVISEVARFLFPDESGGLFIINASRNLVEGVAAWGLPLTDLPVFKPEDCWGLRLGRLHVVEKHIEGQQHTWNTPSMVCNHIQTPNPESYICLPLVAQGEALGLLTISHTRKEGTADTMQPADEWFNENKLQLAQTVTTSLGLALANLKLRESLRQQSIRDSLTGLFNRRYMEETIEREIRRVIRSQHSLGVIMIDIDHFKRFNDNYGHEAGDTVLRELGSFLRLNVRTEDIACRYGGEEFLLIMPEATIEITKQRAEKLREGVNQLSPRYHDQPLGGVMLSMGVAVFPEHGTSAEAVLRAADAALYRAKKAGRNRVEVAETD